MMQAMRIALAGAAVVFLSATPLRAQPREATALYSRDARDCRTLDLKSWSHPTRAALEAAHVGLVRVELCNGDIYPIFTVRFDASPMLGVNDGYFNKLYASMIIANGRHSFAFVDPSWGVIVHIDMTGKTDATISYDEFDAPAAR